MLVLSDGISPARPDQPQIRNPSKETIAETREAERMDPTWEFQAPQFVDFNHLEEKEEEDRRADEFFDVDHENGGQGELWTTALEVEENEEGGGEGPGPASQMMERKVSTPMNGTFSAGASSSSGAGAASQLTFVNVPLVPKVNKPFNLVTSWSQDGRTQKPNQKPQQPVKKRRRLSNAIVKTLMATSGNNNQNQKMTPRRKVPMSIFGYKAGATPKRLKTNLAEPRHGQNVGQTKPKRLLTIATVPKPFKLSTEIRAEERKVFEEKKKKENILHEELKKREKEREEMEQAAQISNYRKTLIHKPQPIKTFKRLEIKRSDKELTLPESPKFVPKRVRKMP